MSKEWEGGKGDRQRPISNRERFDKNWNEIFGKLDNDEDHEDDKYNRDTGAANTDAS